MYYDVKYQEALERACRINRFVEWFGHKMNPADLTKIKEVKPVWLSNGLTKYIAFDEKSNVIASFED